MMMPLIDALPFCAFRQPPLRFHFRQPPSFRHFAEFQPPIFSHHCWLAAGFAAAISSLLPTLLNISFLLLNRLLASPLMPPFLQH
jgi:hypothetical protein